MNGYLPTHLTERSHARVRSGVERRALPQQAHLHGRYDRTRIASEKPAMLATYRMELGDKYIPVKNVFVPLWIKGRRWGNYELAYRDD
jgi:methyl-accepting chemotaxis protein